jgi:hypothetical protein
MKSAWPVYPADAIMPQGIALVFLDSACFMRYTEVHGQALFRFPQARLRALRLYV